MLLEKHDPEFKNDIEKAAFVDVNQDSARCLAARQAYIAARMSDLPVAYTNFMPVTFSAKALWEAERAIRRQYESDQELAQRPWKIVTNAGGFVDFSDMSSDERIEFGANLLTFCGMPAVVKKGFENHPDVLAAKQNAPLTAEWVQVERVEKLRAAAHDASHAYLAAKNGGEDAEEIDHLEDDYKAAMAACGHAEKELQRLKNDRIAACMIVRTRDDLPDDFTDAAE